MKILLLALSAYLLFYSLYWLILTLFGLPHFQPKSGVKNQSNPELLLVLPAYKPGNIFYRVLDSISAAIKGRNIKVLVLFQECDDQELIAYAKASNFFVQEKSFANEEGNTYQHALKYITQQITRGRNRNICRPEFVMLVDKDNLLSLDFFSSIPQGIYDRFDIIQGKRKAIQSTGAIALFDTISELLNDMMFRRAKVRIGGMIEISGSGALIETDLFIQTINKLDPQAPGFDKNFMANLLTSKRDIRSIFWPESVLLEEKTSDINSYNPQRVRWFGEQYYNAIYNAKPLLAAALRYKRFAALDYWITLCRPPRSIQVMIAPFLAIAELAWFAYSNEWYFTIPLFTLSFVVLAISVLIFLSSEKLVSRAVMNSLSLPLLAWRNLLNAAKSIRKENQGKFIHTSHKL
jgi:hypothetical protein